MPDDCFSAAFWLASVTFPASQSCLMIAHVLPFASLSLPLDSSVLSVRQVRLVDVLGLEQHGQHLLLAECRYHHKHWDAASHQLRVDGEVYFVRTGPG